MLRQGGLGLVLALAMLASASAQDGYPQQELQGTDDGYPGTDTTTDTTDTTGDTTSDWSNDTTTAGDTTADGVGTADTSADEYQEPPGREYPVNRVERPLTLPSMHLRGGLSFDILRIDFGMGFDDTLYGLDLHVGLGILDDLEVGFGHRPGWPRAPGLLNVTLAPDGNVNDIYFYVRYRLVGTDTVDLGAEVGVNIPVETDVGLLLGIPVRIRAGNVFGLDTGAAFQLSFPDGADTQAALHIPINPRIAPIDPLYFGINTGVTLPLTDFDGDLVFIPLGFRAGYVLELGALLLDVFASFDFPFFLFPGEGEVGEEIWQISIGARVVADLVPN